MFIIALPVAVLASGVANFLHWALHRHSRFLYWPRGPLGWVVNTLLVAQLVLSVAFLTGLTSNGTFLFALGIYVLIVDLYSIYGRNVSASPGMSAAA